MLIPKRFDLLHQLVPEAKIIGVLVNPNYPDAELQLRELVSASFSKHTIKIAEARSENDLDRAFAALVQERVDALFTTNDPLFNSLRNQIVARAAKYALQQRTICATSALRADS